MAPWKIDDCEAHQMIFLLFLVPPAAVMNSVRFAELPQLQSSVADLFADALLVAA